MQRGGAVRAQQRRDGARAVGLGVIGSRVGIHAWPAGCCEWVVSTRTKGKQHAWPKLSTAARDRDVGLSVGPLGAWLSDGVPER